jgi:S-DNA-T family DNA segregation ATPase FtsK/SpoIIIE
LGANKVRNFGEFNQKLEAGKVIVEPEGSTELDNQDVEPVPYNGGVLPYIVVIVDELADLMMTVQAEIEKPLALIAQKARAAGIHLVLATQRPSVNVLTGVIKANFPTRISFRVASRVDSRTILDQGGAEALLGNGDMLFLPPGHGEPTRSQGAFISTDDTEAVCDWYSDRKEERDEALKKLGRPPREDQESNIMDFIAATEADADSQGNISSTSDRDALFRDAAEVCIQNQMGSTSLLQRRLRIGYGRAARIVDQLEDAGILGPSDDSKAREVRISATQIDEYMS